MTAILIPDFFKYFNDSQREKFIIIYMHILNKKKNLTADDIENGDFNRNYDVYHEWILLLNIIYDKYDLYKNIEHCNVQHVERSKNYENFTFQNVKYLHSPKFVYWKTLEIGKFSPYTSV